MASDAAVANDNGDEDVLRERRVWALGDFWKS